MDGSSRAGLAGCRARLIAAGPRRAISRILFGGHTPVLVDTPQSINILVFLGIWVGALLAQAHRYRRVSGPVQRQQTKWVVFGFGVLAVLLVGFLLPFAVVPSLIQPGRPSLAWDLAGRTIAASFGFLLMPLSIGIAILRHRLSDIDLII